MRSIEKSIRKTVLDVHLLSLSARLETLKNLTESMFGDTYLLIELQSTKAQIDALTDEMAQLLIED